MIDKVANLRCDEDKLLIGRNYVGNDCSDDCNNVLKRIIPQHGKEERLDRLSIGGDSEHCFTHNEKTVA